MINHIRAFAIKKARPILTKSGLNTSGGLPWWSNTLSIRNQKHAHPILVNYRLNRARRLPWWWLNTYKYFQPAHPILSSAGPNRVRGHACYPNKYSLYPKTSGLYPKTSSLYPKTSRLYPKTSTPEPSAILGCNTLTHTYTHTYTHTHTHTHIHTHVHSITHTAWITLEQIDSVGFHDQ
jgi:hypothetical protein